MLLAAIKASEEEKGNQRPSEKAMNARRSVGKKLRLGDY